jgi:murein L,D-transpeptidase YafK
MKSKWLIAGLIVVAVSGLASFRTIERKVFRRNLFKTKPVGELYLIVDKSEYELQVYDADGWYATYPVVFGNKDLSDKLIEGDRRTPEGTFKILSKKPHQKWHKMFMLDYPTPESWAKFKDRKAKGIIPQSAKIGGGIAIHGTWPHDELVVDDYTNWTNGCVALKNEDLDELDGIVDIGTKVIIQR